jgi:AraC-like DNA-binding protein
MTYMVALFRWLTAGPVNPLKVHFSFARPHYFAQYQHFFQCPVKFSQAKDMIVFNGEDMHLPVVWQNSLVNKMFVGKATQKLQAMKQTQNFTNKVSALIMETMHIENPGAERVAVALNVSRRTLHRKLKLENTSYQLVLDQVRKKAALDYIQAERFEFKEIAFRLGYANLSGFYRAFGRWTGHTPLAYRSQN